ncbi:MAG: thymidylate synthase [Patescibacteria group bacterium]
MQWPIYFKDRLEVSNLNSPNAICCLWTPKELIRSMVDSSQYAILGQLYTKKGINYILRNILANPFITRIYLVGNDLMGSGEALLKFKQNGVASDKTIVGENDIQIDKEIPVEAIHAFRKNVEIVDLRGAENLKGLGKASKSFGVSPRKKWRKPEIFPDPPKPQITSYPAEMGLTKIVATTIADGYVQVLRHILAFGITSQPMIGYVSETSSSLKELLNLCVVITSEDSLLRQGFGGQVKVFNFSSSDLENYYKGFFNYNRGTEDYTYGERLFNYGHDQMEDLKKAYPFLKISRFNKLFPHGGFDQVAGSIVRKLSKFPYDKGAIALLGNVASDIFPQRPPKKTPCLFLIQCQIYQGKLNLTAYFRSNDMYNAWPLNTFALRKLQDDTAQKLNCGVGPLVTISNMAHIYEHNLADAQKIVDANLDKTFCSWDSCGNFIVAVDKSTVVVKLISPEGNTELRSWSMDGKVPNASRELCTTIEKDLGVSTIGNAMYLGRQLERAETAVKLGIEYRQDNPLELFTC